LVGADEEDALRDDRHAGAGERVDTTGPRAQGPEVVRRDSGGAGQVPGALFEAHGVTATTGRSANPPVIASIVSRARPARTLVRQLAEPFTPA
jgi:hypothetical protein